MKYQIWDVKCMKEGQRWFLKNLDNKGSVNILKEEKNTMNVMIDGSRSLQIQKLLCDRDIQYEVAEGQVSRNRSPTGTKLTRRRSPITVMDWNDFYPLRNIYHFMENLEVCYPSVCTVSTIGRTTEGREIKILKISNSNSGNTGVWIDGGIHAREWIAPSVVTYIADQVARNMDTSPEYITNKDWYFLPVVNPDGYVYSHTTDRMWRKSRARIGSSVYGVDLNRNFGYRWFSRDDCPGDDPCHLNYRGTQPFSEPETTAVKDLILYAGVPFKIFLTLHAYSEVISFPWCFTAEPCADYVNLLEGATAMTKAIFDVNGRMYKVGNFKDIMYPASGTSIDWSYGTARIPFSYLIELRSKQHKFLLPKEEILDCCKEVYAGVKALALFVDRKKCLNCSMFFNKQNA
ncbi:carboxypeptidase B-like [Bicyclus anynana]|uniref:Carboxypeptidase B-like n=1 Tax=Bicyclus anynana TaxID=110368 RepID=A0ABM3LWU1_BICAN|nr:carboxypeptidase B-like [Bicyclus anynana]